MTTTKYFNATDYDLTLRLQVSMTKISSASTMEVER